MGPEKSHEPKKHEAPDPFISKEDRPDLTIDLNKKLGELTVRELKTLLGGGSSSPAKSKEALVEKGELIDKIPTKDTKDIRDNKIHKEPKDTKDNKDSKDPKDQKEPKDTKDNKDNKDPKDSKDNKDNKDHKDGKDHKDAADNKSHKDPKEAKDAKDVRDIKGELIDKVHKDSLETLPQSALDPSGAQGSVGGSSNVPPPPTSLESLIERLTGLEKEVKHLRGTGDGGAAKK